ncbi:MAG: hypothetical protein A2586_00220 [Candidatus Harrisonbacteria bacterium RIFOXYD1_FULL_40_9]|uniref:Peptidase M50 domain-containing protein n=1 Tax=Candidatus Harrisonbacteria bacterium RIFOXYD1_FULL_40_9 TaxID=1798412 RepID=A0A1G2A075_9BACT|nr:MAG: hypothetical protein A2586_00220 [Candidatus Harrisonbacteria bacterium RIFOXYD1_FULL_40_9]
MFVNYSMNISIFLFVLIIFIFSAIIHEVSHGAMAYYLGDPTAKNLGRLTLNPIPHIDPFGSIVLPLILLIPALFGYPTLVFGWAKPVPYDPRFLKNPLLGAALIAGAGPFSNLSIAFLLGTLIKFASLTPALTMLFGSVVWVNIVLGIFNLVPIAPLDGSKVFVAFLGSRAHGFMRFMEQYGMVILIVFIIWGFDFLVPIISYLFKLFTGM